MLEPLYSNLNSLLKVGSNPDLDSTGFQDLRYEIFTWIRIKSRPKYGMNLDQIAIPNIAMRYSGPWVRDHGPEPGNEFYLDECWWAQMDPKKK